MNKSKKILLFGNERIATSVETKAPIFRYLMQNYNVVGLVVSEKKNMDSLEVVKLAKENNIEVYNFTKLKDSIEDIRKLEADIAVLIAYGKIIPQSIIDIFPMGILNIHPSLLPMHRGPTPLESVILGNETKTGVSLMHLSSGMDSGPVYAQKTINLNQKETKQELANILDELGYSIFKEDFEDILSGKITPVEQKDELATYDQLINKTNSNIDWKKSSLQIINKIRAYEGWPGTKTILGKLNVNIVSADISDHKGNPGEFLIENGRLYIYTLDSSLEIKTIQPEGRKIMTARDFLLGYSNKIN
ncbi:MAG: methionyl-tRNA formyltransferase [bacterium]